MPNKIEGAAKSQETLIINDPYIRISQADLTNQQELNKKLTKACKMGFFYLEMPEDCKPLVDRAVDLGNSFYRQEEYTSLHLKGFSGYHDREVFQVESLYLEKEYWSEKMPPHLRELSLKMEAIAIDLLKKTLSVCNIPEEQWERGSGGVTESRGQMHFTFNHYRAEKKNVEGLGAHRDFGQITVLHINKKGLQARIEGVWQEVLPVEGYFVINFGRALETLVNDPTQLTAAWHRVPPVDDRISLGIFADNNNDTLIYQRQEDGTLYDTGDTYGKYLKNSFAEYYPDDDN